MTGGHSDRGAIIERGEFRVDSPRNSVRQPLRVVDRGVGLAQLSVLQGVNGKNFVSSTIHLHAYIADGQMGSAEPGAAGVPRRNQQRKCLNRRGLDPLVSVMTEPRGCFLQAGVAPRFLYSIPHLPPHRTALHPHLQMLAGLSVPRRFGIQARSL